MSSRREFMQQLTALAALVPVMGLGLASHRALAAESGWFMPDEAEQQARAFVAYAAQVDIWEDWTDAVNESIGELARTIARYQPVTVLCRPEDLADAKAACGTTNTDFLTLPVDDIWCRDYGGCFVLNDDGDLGLVDFNFNGWGGKQAHRNDAAVAQDLSDEFLATYVRSELTGEGGGIEVDGHGTAILTESCWINSNRNPGWSKAEIEDELKAMLGLRKIIWLPGIKGKDITDAHVDFYARFVRPGVVIVNLETDPQSYDYAVTRKHLEILKSATDADGNPLQVHTLPPPRQLRSNEFTDDNPDFAPGYINYLVINDAVIAPQFGDAAADKYCNELLTKLYPDREVVQLDIDPIAAGGGGIHCITKNMPLSG
jgi:agmatine deiminase